MNRSFILPMAAALVISSCKGKKEETASPVVSPVTEAVFAPGHVEADDEFALTALYDGYVKEVLVSNGDTVNTNQPLLIQDNSAGNVQQQTNTASLRITEQLASEHSAVLQQLESQLRSANDKLENDKKQMERMQRLFATHSVAKIELDNAGLSYNNSLNNVASVQQNIAATKLSLQQTLISSRGQEQSTAVSNSYYHIKSPGRYKIYSLLKKKGDLVRRGETVAILGNTNSMKIVLTIDEASIAKIKQGQKLLVELNTEKDKTYTGSISKIYPAFDATTQSYTAEARLDSTSVSIINGTLLQANIIVDKKDKALLIPRTCLGADGNVWIKRANGTDTVTVKTGIVSNEWVEILSGVDINDKLVKRF